MQPTLRGTVRLKSWNPKDMPLRPEADRHNTREGLSKVQQIIVEKMMAKDLMPLSSTFTDDEVDTPVQ